MYGTSTLDVFPVTDANGIDVSNCEGIIFFTVIAPEDVTSKLHAQAGDSANQCATPLAGSLVTAIDGCTLLAVDIYRPADKFVRPVLAGVTNQVFALKYGGRTIRGTGAPVVTRVVSPKHGRV